MSSEIPSLILYHYTFSPYARRVVWYLALRRIPYSQVLTAPILPRPAIQKDLGVAYRRIPILAIGRDVYCDTRLILHRLENTNFPAGSGVLPPLGSRKPAEQALETLLRRWAVDELFGRASQLIPTDTPLMRDPKFVRDRSEFSGRSWSAEDQQRGRGEAVEAMRAAFSIVEGQVLGDGRDWVLGTTGPSLADVEIVWPMHWLIRMPNALPPELISREKFPRVWAWVERFDKAVKEAMGRLGKPATLQGQEAAERILGMDYAEVEFDGSNALGLSEGQLVEAYPIDTGFRHRDRGKLIGLNAVEMVVQGQTGGGGEIRIHYPRTGCRVRAVEGAKL